MSDKCRWVRTLILMGIAICTLIVWLPLGIARENVKANPPIENKRVGDINAKLPIENRQGPRRRTPSSYPPFIGKRLPRAEANRIFSNGGRAHVAHSTWFNHSTAAIGIRHFGQDFKTKVLAAFASRAQIGGYKEDPLLYRVVEDFPDIFMGKHVVVPGSELPHYEYFLVYHAKAAKTTTLEYRMFECEDPNIKVTLVEDFWKAPTTFDAAVSYSNFEHDGLGRYGDPIDPDGDLKAAAEMWSLIKPGGHMVLAVPVGPDCVEFNAHRIYGHIRLPKILRGWKLLRTYNVDVPKYPACGKGKRGLKAHQGAFILRRDDDPNFVDLAGLERECPRLLEASDAAH